jgi:hypothetical protein
MATAKLLTSYPILIAFFKQALLTLTDEAVEMFDQCLWDCHRPI